VRRVANRCQLDRNEPGGTVLDLGCGADTDLLIAAQLRGLTAGAIGVHDRGDTRAGTCERSAHGALTDVDLHEGRIRSLPINDGSVAVVISDGALDLVPDEEAVC
jgi:arsenite methyltransferase